MIHAGARNFFGRKIGQTIMRGVEALSPLQIHRGASARVLQSTEKAGLAATREAAGSMFDTIDRTMTTNTGLWRAIRGTPKAETGGPGLGEMVQRYFQGQTTADMALDYGVSKQIVEGMGFKGAGDVAAQRFRQGVRVGTFSAIGLGAGSSFFFGEGNPISSTLSFGARGVGHAGIAYGLGSMVHPLAGSAYLGVTAINALRAGDNMGPM